VAGGTVGGEELATILRMGMEWQGQYGSEKGGSWHRRTETD